MPLRTGSPAEGQDFFGRQIELAMLWRVLLLNHLVLTAQRRLGKSSLLKKLLTQAPAHGLLGVYLDLSGCTSAADFIRKLSDAVPETTIAAHWASAKSKAADWIASITKLKFSLPGDAGLELETRERAAKTWQEQAELLRQRLSQRPVLMVLDEFSVFIQRLLKTNPAEAQELLSVLRSWRQHGDGVVCRFIFSGSVGLNRLLERHGHQTETNDCDDFSLGPFQLPDAVSMIVELAQRERWPATPALAYQLCERVGWLSPYYLVTALEERYSRGHAAPAHARAH